MDNLGDHRTIFIGSRIDLWNDRMPAEILSKIFKWKGGTILPTPNRNYLEEKLRIYLDVERNLRTLAKELRLLKSPERNAIQEEELDSYLSSVKTYQTQKSQLKQMIRNASQRLVEAHITLRDALPLFDVWVIVKMDNKQYAVGKYQRGTYKGSFDSTHSIELKVRFPHWLRLRLPKGK